MIAENKHYETPFTLLGIRGIRENPPEKKKRRTGRLHQNFCHQKAVRPPSKSKTTRGENRYTLGEEEKGEEYASF